MLRGRPPIGAVRMPRAVVAGETAVSRRRPHRRLLVGESVHGVLGLARARLDLVAVLALGLLVDRPRGLVEALVDLVPVLLREVADLVLGRGELGLQIVQQTHGSPSLAGQLRAGALTGLAVGRLVGGLLLRDLDAARRGLDGLRRRRSQPRPRSPLRPQPTPSPRCRRVRLGLGRQVRRPAPRRLTPPPDNELGPSVRRNHAKTPISTPYVTRVGEIPRYPVRPFAPPGHRSAKPAAETSQQATTPARVPSRNSFGSRPEVCETGAVRRPAPAPRVIAVVGPTAAGKSDLGVFLARQLGGEVVNADSMQLYRGMDIGTAKLTPEERGGVPHRLLDIWDVTEAASVAEYQRLARVEIDRLLAEGRYPGPGRRLGAVRPRGRRRPGVPRHRPRRTGPARGGAHAARLRRPARPARRRGPRGGPGHPAQQRPPYRPRPGGHRDHRQALHRQPPRP